MFRYSEYDEVKPDTSFEEIYNYIANTNITEQQPQYDNISSRKNLLTGETFLHVFTRIGSIEKVNYLIQLGSDVNAQDKHGRTPLYWAIEKSGELVKLLMNNGADYDITDEEGVTPLHRALCQSSLEIVLFLIKKNCEVKSSVLRVLRHQTSNYFKNCRDIVDFLLKKTKEEKRQKTTGLNFHKNKYPVLHHFVAKHGNEDIFKMLPIRSRYYNINALNPEKHALIHILLDTNKETLFKILIHSGAKINTPGSPRSALHYAIMKNNSSLVRWIIIHQANVNALSVDGRTPLHYAARIGNTEIVKMLLEAGAKINVRNHNGITPLHEACGGFLNSDAFISGSALYYKEISKFKNIFHEEVIKLLLERGANTEYKKYTNMFSPFHSACRGGSLTAVKLLHSFRANIRAREIHSQTGLHLAAYNNNLDIVNFLLTQGFDINIMDEDEETPLHSVIKDQKKHCLETIEFLLDNGADLNIPDFDYITPFEYALKLKNIEVLDSLLEFQVNMVFLEDEFYNENNIPTLQLFNKKCSKYIIAFDTAFVFARSGLSTICQRNYSTKHINTLKYWSAKCSIEVSEMKTTRICQNRNITYLNFLTATLMRATSFARSGDLIQELESCDYRSKFPCYAIFLKNRIERVKKLRVLLHMAEKFLKKYSRSNLPLIIIWQIFSYLNLSDVRNFGRALSGIY